MKTIISIICIILLASCDSPLDSIHNHKDQVIVEKERTARGKYYITTRVKTKYGYEFLKFRVYSSEVQGLMVNDTIK